MKEYFKLNKHKFPFAIGLTWLVFFLLSLIPVFASSGTSTAMEVIQSLVLCLLVTGILTVLILGLSFLSGYSEFQARSRRFRAEPWGSVFHRLNFEPHLIKVNSKYQLVQQVLLGKIRGFTVLVQQEKGKKNEFIFNFIAERKVIEKERFDQLKKLFKDRRAEFAFGSINLKLPVNTTAIATTIEKELNDFAELLIAEGFSPGSMQVRG